MAQQYQTAPTTRYTANPASGDSPAGDLINMSLQVGAQQANQEAARFMERRASFADQMATIQNLDSIASSMAKQASEGDPNKQYKDELEYLKTRGQIFDVNAQIVNARRLQESKEADFILAEPLAQLGAMAGTQNWGSFYAQRKAIVTNPFYGKTREIQNRIVALDQVIQHWGEAYDSQGRAKSFLDVSKEADASDWTTRKEALRILALKSESPSGFLTALPDLTATQRGELMSFIEKNPLINDDSKIQQYRDFEKVFQQKLMENAGSDPQRYLSVMSAPETQRQLADARRAILYGAPSDDMTYVDATDKTFTSDTLDRLNEHMNMRIDNSAGMLSLTRIGREIYTHGRRKLFDKDYGSLTDEELLEVQSPEALERLSKEAGFFDDIGKAVMAGGPVAIGTFYDKVKNTASIISKALPSNVPEEVKAAQAFLNSPAAKVAMKTQGASKVLSALTTMAKYSGKSSAWVVKNTLPAQMVAPLLRKLGVSGLAKSAATKMSAKVAAAGGAKFAGKVVGTAVGLGLDAMFFMKDAGNDMGQVSDAFKTIKTNQKILQTALSQGVVPREMDQIFGNLQQAVMTVNTISDRHGLNIALDMNNIVSKQMAARLSTKSAVDTAMQTSYGISRPMQPAQRVPLDQIGIAQTR